MPPSHEYNDDVIRQVVTRLLSAMICNREIVNFMDSHVEHFNESTLGEHSLKYTEIHNDYVNIMEKFLSSIGQDIGCGSDAEFILFLRGKIETEEHQPYQVSNRGKTTLILIGQKNLTTTSAQYGEDKKQQRMMDLILGIFDYEKFVLLMRLKAQNVAMKMKKKREEGKNSDQDDGESKIEESKHDGSDVDMFASSDY